MKKGHIEAFLDLGSQNIKIILIRVLDNLKTENIACISEKSEGINDGSIVDQSLVSEKLSLAIDKLENRLGMEIDSTSLLLNSAFTNVHKEFMELKLKNPRKIRAEDIEWLAEKTEKRIRMGNRNDEIIFKQEYQVLIDGKEIPCRSPIGYFAKKTLSINYIFITASKAHLTNIRNVVEDVNLDMNYEIPAIMAMEHFLSNDQRKTTTCVVDIGSNILTMALFRKGLLVDVQTLNLGGDLIKEEVASSLNLELTEAEQKKKYDPSFERNREIEKIIQSKLKEMALHIQKYLKDHSVEKLLPGGVVLSGGVANEYTIKEAFRSILKLPIYIVQSKESSDKHNLGSSWGLLKGAICFYIADSNIPPLYKASGIFNKLKRKLKNVLD